MYVLRAALARTTADEIDEGFPDDLDTPWTHPFSFPLAFLEFFPVNQL